MRKPLPETVCASYESGEIVRVEVSCHRLPPMCKTCLEAGHLSKHCPKTPPLCSLCNKAFHDPNICPLKLSENDEKEASGSSSKSTFTQRPGKEKLSSANVDNKTPGNHLNIAEDRGSSLETVAVGNSTTPAAEPDGTEKENMNTTVEDSFTIVSHRKKRKGKGPSSPDSKGGLALRGN